MPSYASGKIQKNVQEKKELALSQADMLRIQAMVATLKETSRFHASSFADVDFKLITKLVLQWPVEHIFPGMQSLCVHPGFVISLAATLELFETFCIRI